MSFAPLTSPARGTGTNASEQVLVYVPAGTNFTGTDSFDYVATNSCGDRATNTVTLHFVGGPILFHDCNPFGPAVKLGWVLDATDEWLNLTIDSFVIYRGPHSGGPYTAIATNYNDSADWMTHLDRTAVVGQTYYYVVTLRAYDTASILHESPVSNEIGATAQTPGFLIATNAVWQVVTNLANPSIVTNLRTPFASTFPYAYGDTLPGPNTYWPSNTTWSNHITMYIPSNSVPLAQVNYSIAIDNNYKLYLNNPSSPVETFDHENYAAWAPFKTFESVAPNRLHYGTNDIGVVIVDTGEISYFSMIVTTNNCGL